jgi:glycosyltransferase involved in cell wall biosynthesis
MERTEPLCPTNNPKRVAIAGTRGVPARHGGFETFAEHLALYLVKHGWDVTVFCQQETSDDASAEWNGIHLANIKVPVGGALGSIIFDWITTMRCARRFPLVLTLGYNTGAFGFLYRLTGTRNLINMDGLEWQRQKWSRKARAWLYANERLSCWLGNHLIADHPEIQKHLATRVSDKKIRMIAYGADRITTAAPDTLNSLGLRPDKYALVIARPEPENMILEIVRAYSSEPRGMPMVVLGNYHPGNPYHDAVRAAASPEVLFPGAIYEREKVEALRLHCRYYVHGHTVGGTNPSLVEALAAGNAVLAHDNPFNRWTAGDGAIYFSDEASCREATARLVNASPESLEAMRSASLSRHAEAFRWEDILSQYEELLDQWWRTIPPNRLGRATSNAHPT